jgi:hypothetical protein
MKHGRTGQKPDVLKTWLAGEFDMPYGSET